MLSNIKTTGVIQKCQIIIITNNIKKELSEFLKKEIDPLWEPEEIIEAWVEKEKDYILFPLNRFKHTFNTMNLENKIFSFNNIDFLVIKIIDEKSANELKNTFDLPDEGKIITPFGNRFIPKNKYTDDDTFKLNEDEFIYNNIRLVLDQSRSKLTGRAAEIAKRKGKL